MSIQRYHLLVCDLHRLFYKTLKLIGGKRVRIFDEARVKIFVGGLCEYKVSSLVKTKRAGQFLMYKEVATYLPFVIKYPVFSEGFPI